MDSDSFLEILKNVKTVRDLLSMCSVNKVMFEYCEDNKRSLWRNLIKNMDFKRDYYRKFDFFLKHSDYHSILKLLNIYSIDNYEQQDFLNNLYEFLQNNRRLDEYKEFNIKIYFKLLFYPPEFFKLRLSDIKYFDDDENMLIINYFLNNPDKQILAGFVNDIINDHKRYPRGYMYLRELYKYLPEDISNFTTDVIYNIIFEELDGNPFEYTPNTIEFQEIFGDVYEDIIQFYKLFNIEKYRLIKNVEFQKLWK
jgi:hypothetical protein